MREFKPKFKKGDMVVMHTCHEASLPEYKGRIWTCMADSYLLGGYEENEGVFLEGFSGAFSCKYLQTVNI